MPEPISQERWERILEAFRRDPGNINGAAKAANANWRTAKWQWEHGSAGRPAMREIIAAEQAALRAQLAVERSHNDEITERNRAVQAEEFRQMRAELTTAQAQMAEERARFDAYVRAREGDVESVRRKMLEVAGIDADASRVKQGKIAKLYGVFS